MMNSRSALLLSSALVAFAVSLPAEAATAAQTVPEDEQAQETNAATTPKPPTRRKTRRSSSPRKSASKS